MPSRLEFKNKSIGNEENRQSRCLPMSSDAVRHEFRKNSPPPIPLKKTPHPVLDRLATGVFSTD